MKKPTYPIPKAPVRHTDLTRLGQWLPEPWLPYAQALRLDRPAGYWLLLLPAWFAILLASPALSFGTLWLTAIFFLGAVALRGAGCIINDLWDRELDRHVSRTADRPLATGTISGRQALMLVGGLLLIGLFVLAFLPWRVWVWALFSLPLIALYPVAKRYIPTPQAVLGLTFSWGALLGWLAVQPTLSLTTLWLYLGSFCWILYYDSIYATQDRSDDAQIGLHSLPLFLGDQLHAGLAFFAGATVACWALALAFAGAGFLAWLGLMIVAGLLYQQWSTFDPDDPALCLAQFKGNVYIGQLFAGFLALALLL